MVGTLARETPQEIVLRNAAGAEQPIPKADVAKREQGTASIMPAGLIDALNEQEQTDLFAFLARLGKPGDFDASRGGVARRWHVAFTVHTDAQAGNEGWPLTASYSDKRWIHTTSLVSGVLSRAAIEMMTRLPYPMLRYTAEHFPHIVDRLASEWANPIRMAGAIDDLIYDMRGGRAGFPMQVLNELGVLRERYERWVGPARMR